MAPLHQLLFLVLGMFLGISTIKVIPEALPAVIYLFFAMQLVTTAWIFRITAANHALSVFVCQ
jgi:hypothetical protein